MSIGVKCEGRCEWRGEWGVSMSGGVCRCEVCGSVSVEV